MSWRAYVCDTMSGQLVAPIDLPSFAWSVSVSDSTLSTTRDKGVGEADASGLKLPWGAVPGSSYAEKRGMLAADRRSICLLWRTSSNPMDLGVPILFGAISPRTDTWNDTSFTLNSVMGLLDSRYCVREGVFGMGPKNTSRDEITFTGRSLRAIAAEVGSLCTDMKPGGRLPIDWNWIGEAGSHERTYKAFDVQNLSAKQIMEKIANVDDGIDMQFRPYLTGDGTAVRLSFEAATDADRVLSQDQVVSFGVRRHGGDLEDVSVDHVGPVMRVYANGSGADKAQLGFLAEDLTLATQADPWPLREMTFADSDTDKASLLAAHARGVLAANMRPLMQIKGSVNANDRDQSGVFLHPLGAFWPGQCARITMDGFPGLPDGVYLCRLMEMSGDETANVKLTFDVMADPVN